MATIEERAQIAMEEYKVLHAELVQRNTVLMQLVGGSMAAIVGLIGFTIATDNLGAGLSLIVLVVFFIGLAWRFVDSDARKACRRIIEIEEYVNSAFGGDDRNPLSWERRFGLLSRSYLDRMRDDEFGAK